MPRVNATCKVCGKSYTHCTDAVRIGSWRAICCSPECWNKWVDAIRCRKQRQQSLKLQEVIVEDLQDKESNKESPADEVVEAED